MAEKILKTRGVKIGEKRGSYKRKSEETKLEEIFEKNKQEINNNPNLSPYIAPINEFKAFYCKLCS